MASTIKSVKVKNAPFVNNTALIKWLMAGAVVCGTVWITGQSLSFAADDVSSLTRLVQSGQYAEAISRIDSQLQNKPKDPQLRFLKGVALTESNKVSEAITTFSRLTEDYPELPEPYNNLAVLYAAQGQYDKARTALEMAIRTNPSYATAHENLGDVYAKLASQAYGKALQLDTANTQIPPKLNLIRGLFPGSTAARPATPVASARPPSIPPSPSVSASPAPVTITPPTITPPPVVATNPSPVTPRTTPPSAPAATDAKSAQADVKSAIEQWAQAWADKNMNRYFDAYQPQINPSGSGSRASWEEDRRNRIVSKKNISVTVSDFDIQIQGDKAVALFRQSYASDSIKANGRKKMELVKSGNRWLISREATL